MIKARLISETFGNKTRYVNISISFIETLSDDVLLKVIF